MKPWVGVDIDGVLADQAPGMIWLMREKYGEVVPSDGILTYTPSFADSNWGRFVTEAYENEGFVAGMPEIAGARESLRELSLHFNVALVTSRQSTINHLTQAWLNDHGMLYDRLINAPEGKKQDTGLDLRLLIDDYHVNVEAFLRNSDGSAVLFDRPWNRKEAVEFLPSELKGRCVTGFTWDDLHSVIDKMFLITFTNGSRLNFREPKTKLRGVHVSNAQVID